MPLSEYCFLKPYSLGETKQMAQRGLRLTEDLQRRINAAVEERGMNSAAAFIRLALQNELDRAESERRIEALEERMAATLSRIADEVRKAANGQQATIALIDSLSKVILTCVPEPEAATFNRAVSLARDRYQKFIKSAASSMKGNFIKSLTDIIL
jgi:Arc/MetJ-type ribon-helix-helix transcriptional regulator